MAWLELNESNGKKTLVNADNIAHIVSFNGRSVIQLTATTGTTGVSIQVIESIDQIVDLLRAAGEEVQRAS